MKKNYNSFIAGLGVGVEYYDFIIYGLMGTYLSDVFFQGDPSSNRFYYFAVFSLGYIARPFGGTVFGLISDKYGRKSAFSTMMLITIFATLVIAILPTGEQWLRYSVTALIISRIAQGVAMGGELPNASTMLHETGNKDPLQQGFLLVTTVCGNLLALFALSIISHILSKAEMKEWGWRIPFAFGASLGVVSFYLRKGLRESDEYLKIKKEVSEQNFFYPIKALVASPVSMIFAILASFCMANFVLLFFYMPTYLHQFFGYKTKDVYSFMTVSLFFSATVLLFAGSLMRKISAVKISITATVTLVLVCYPMIRLLLVQHKISLLCFLMLYQFFTSLIAVVTLVKLSNIFEVKSRNTSIAFCYNVGFALASMVPSIVSLVINTSQDKEILLIYLAAIALLHMIGVIVLNFRGQKISNDS